MKIVTFLLVLLGLGACGVAESPELGARQAWHNIRVEPVWDAVQYIGLDERKDRAELRELIGVDPVRVEWCAAFVNAVLEQNRISGSSRVSEYPLTARSFLEWGQPVDHENIRRGDIVIFPRGSESWQGHVGFFWGKVDRNGREYWQILGGNQGNRVGIELYRADRALGVRRQTFMMAYNLAEED